MYIPEKTLDRVITSADVLNAIRNSNTIDDSYRAIVPEAQKGSLQSLREIGSVFTGVPEVFNVFLKTLINRIGIVKIQSALFHNPLSEITEKGILEFGDTVEEIFVDLCEAVDYNVWETDDVWKVQPEDLRAVFHSINYQKKYPRSISYTEVRQAFTSWQGVDNLIARIITSMYTSAERDAFLMTKYVLAKNTIEGYIPIKKIAPLNTEDNVKAFAQELQSMFGNFQFLSGEYNLAGVDNTTPPQNMYLILTTDANAAINVGSYAYAFNLDKIEFSGKQKLVDSFGKIDIKRLTRLIENSVNPTIFTPEQLEEMENVVAYFVDERFFQFYTSLFTMDSIWNPSNRVWNYWLHIHKVISISPFNNIVGYTVGTQSVDSITVDPTSATVKAGTTYRFNAIITGENFPSNGVNWSISGYTSSSTTIDDKGNLFVGNDEAAGTTITVTAISDFDTTKKGTATVTVSASAKSVKNAK
ncbi:MAG: hypothetical protein K2G70_07640 [Turicibacter sp.]|nr:hypothetical protein [Turicibacter sp.]